VSSPDGVGEQRDTIASFARQVLQGRGLDPHDARRLVDAGREDPYELLEWAWRIRVHHFGRGVKLCSIVSGKQGACSEDCAWCAQSAVASPRAETPERTELREILQAARQARSIGVARIGLVNSGRMPNEKDLNAIIAASRDICESLPEIEPCASLGELTPEMASRLAASGVKRYHHNLETSARLFPQMVSTHSYEDRLRTLRNAREAGMHLCCGGIFGLGETWDDRLRLAFALRDEIRPVSVPLNFLHPIPGTRLGGLQPLPAMEALQVIAVFRFLLPKTDLRLAGGREHVLGDLQSWMFYAGATGCMVGHYLTTSGRSVESDLAMIKQLGLEVVTQLPERPEPM
jgi:biotin synthase